MICTGVKGGDGGGGGAGGGLGGGVSAACNAAFDLHQSQSAHEQKAQCTVANGGLQMLAHDRVDSPYISGLHGPFDCNEIVDAFVRGFGIDGARWLGCSEEFNLGYGSNGFGSDGAWWLSCSEEFVLGCGGNAACRCEQNSHLVHAQYGQCTDAKLLLQ